MRILNALILLATGAALAWFASQPELRHELGRWLRPDPHEHDGAAPAPSSIWRPAAARADAAQEWTPPPAADPRVRRHRSGRVDPRVTDLPPALEATLRQDPDDGVDALVAHLVDEAEDQAHLVKLIHDWIAEHVAYDVAMLRSRHIVNRSWRQTLIDREAVCGGYTALFAHMADLGGVESARVSGYGRGELYDLFKPEEPGRAHRGEITGHAWSAVSLDDRWYLLDVTWDAGSVDGDQFNKRYSTDFLFLEPEHFVHTHLPRDPSWQLLDPPVTEDEFVDLLPLKGGFFHHGLSFENPVNKLNQAEGWTLLKLRAPGWVDLSARLSRRDGRELPRRGFVQHRPGGADVHLRFPEEGEYVLKLFARMSGEARYGDVVTLGFVAEAGHPEGFPRVLREFVTRAAALEEPLVERLPRDRPVRLVIEVPDACAVKLHDGSGAWHPFTRAERGGDRFTLEYVAVGPGPFQVMVQDNEDPTRYWSMVEYD